MPSGAPALSNDGIYVTASPVTAGKRSNPLHGGIGLGLDAG
jgi:hypothetical protein